MSKTKPVGRNDTCPCKSGKKYKKCCQLNNSNNIVECDLSKCSDILRPCIEIVTAEFPNHTIIDITSELNNNTYRPLQTKYYSSNVIMMAEKTDTNESVFATRVNSSESNIMFLYHGSYRTFNDGELFMVMTSLHELVER